MDELSRARLKRQREQMRNLDRWTPRQALEAILADLDLEADERQPETITVVVSYSEGQGEDRRTYVEQYCGTDGTTGPKDTFWIVGVLTKAIQMWLR